MELALICELIVGGVGLVILFNVSIHLLNKHIHNSISKLMPNNKVESYYSVVLKGKQDIIILSHFDTYNYLKRFNKDNKYVWYVAFQIKGEDVLLVEKTSIKDLFYITPHSCNCEACQQKGDKKVRVI